MSAETWTWIDAGALVGRGNVLSTAGSANRRMTGPITAMRAGSGGPVRALRFSVWAQETCAAILARRRRCAAVTPPAMWVPSWPSDTFAEPQPTLQLLSTLGRRTKLLDRLPIIRRMKN